ncbi:MAG: hypothetical protein P4L91_12055 [Burkholderiaceae bacterium]|nr:hypothetical protein [Burkholderiaceae bacterium]
MGEKQEDLRVMRFQQRLSGIRLPIEFDRGHPAAAFKRKAGIVIGDTPRGRRD